MTDLTTWLLSQIDADEAVAVEGVETLGDWAEDSADLDAGALLWQAKRTLAQCAAHRRIVELHSPEVDACPPMDTSDDAAFYDSWCPTLRAIAGIYADRPGFREEWALSGDTERAGGAG